MNKGMGGHQSAKMMNDEWLTPPEILADLGPFDLDPCAPIVRPWSMANKHFTKIDDGLKQKWFGHVWCNPPYGKVSDEWLNRMVEHRNGLAMIFARTETVAFFEHVWEKADGLFFLKGRVTFRTVEGVKAPHNGGAPSVVIAYGKEGVERLKRTKLIGKFIPL